MLLFTKTQYAKLIANGSDQNPYKDYPPVVKLFMTGTGCTWLISELDPENPDIAFALCDTGWFGFPEMGYISINELKQAQGSLRFLERDYSFEGKYPLSSYATAARSAGQIIENDTVLQRVLPMLKL